MLGYYSAGTKVEQSPLCSSASNTTVCGGVPNWTKTWCAASATTPVLTHWSTCQIAEAQIGHLLKHLPHNIGAATLVVLQYLVEIAYSDYLCATSLQEALRKLLHWIGRLFVPTLLGNYFCSWRETLQDYCGYDMTHYWGVELMKLHDAT